MEKRKITVDWYHGSLDFPCDICNSNSYRNFHIKKDGEIIAVVCKSCLDKAEHYKL